MKINEGDFAAEQFTVDDFSDSLLVFDDVDCISSKVLTTGRHAKASCIYTTQTACNGVSTKLILAESHSTTFFIAGMGGKSSKYLLDGYLGLDRSQISRIKQSKVGGWTVLKTYPQLILSQKQLIFSKDL